MAFLYFMLFKEVRNESLSLFKTRQREMYDNIKPPPGRRIKKVFMVCCSNNVQLGKCIDVLNKAVHNPLQFPNFVSVITHLGKCIELIKKEYSSSTSCIFEDR